jgi:hypothetical protein
MTRQPRIVRLAISVSLIFTFSTLRATAQTSGPPAGQLPGPRSRPPQPQMDQMTNIPYFTLRDGMSSILTLNNVASTPTKVTVTIFNTEGRANVLDPITLNPHSVKEVQLAGVVPEGFGSGNIQVAFHGIDMAVTCQVSVSNLEKRVSFESREQDMMDFASVNSNGILWLPQKEALGFLALTNIAKNNVTIQLTIGSKIKVVTLTPRETQLLKLNEEFDRAPQNDHHEATLVRLQHTGLAGDIITTGFVLNLKNGYSSGFAMRDPSIGRSSTLAGTHFRAGQPDPSEGFPEGTRFRSPLLLANVSANPVVAHVSVDYTVMDNQDSRDNGGDAQENSTRTPKDTVVKVKDLTIAPGNVARVELSDALDGIGPIAEAGVDIAYDAEPGAVIGQLTSADQSGDYAFETPIKDPAGATETLAAAYPWTIDKGTDTVLHLKNTTADSASALVTFLFSGGGTYYLDPIIFKPYESVAIDIQKIKESKRKDALQRVFPPDATYGQVQWHQDIPYSIIGRAEETNVKTGIARSFSCPVSCCYYAYTTYWLSTASSLTELAGSNIMVTGTGQTTDCNNVTYAPFDSIPYSWSSDSITIASVSAGTDADDQTVNYVGAGTTKIWGNNFGPSWEYNFSPTGICQARHTYREWDYVQVTTCVPASVRIIDDISTTVSGTQYVYNNCSAVYENEGSPTWGNTHCYTFQLVDSCGRDITSGNYRANEVRRVFRMNPNQTVVDIPTPIINGRWVDWMTYLYTQSPGVPSGYFLKVNQTIHVINQVTGRDDPVATYCQYYDPYNVYHYSGACS